MGKRNEAAEVAATDALARGAEEIRQQCEEDPEIFEHGEDDAEVCNPWDAEEEVDTPYEDSGDGEGEGMVDASASIPEVQETVIIDLPMSDVFTHPLPVFLTDVELGCYSKHQAELWTKWGRLNQQKKDSAKAYGDSIKKVEDELDEITRIVEEGSEERPVECRWLFDYQHGIKKLIRLDRNVCVEEETLTKAELEAYRQPDLLAGVEESVAAVEECFGYTDASAEDGEPAEGDICPAEDGNLFDGSSTVEDTPAFPELPDGDDEWPVSALREEDNV